MQLQEWASRMLQGFCLVQRSTWQDTMGDGFGGQRGPREQMVYSDM